MDADQAPTRAAVLELRAERSVVLEAYDFLDEKRLLLAAELLKQLKQYEELRISVEEKTQEAHAYLQAGVYRHGLQALEVYPPLPLDDARLELSRHNLMGVVLQSSRLLLTGDLRDRAPVAGDPSVEAEQCRAVFLELVELGAELAGVSGNLYRLFAEYKQTERRSRALENVFLPDIENALRRMTAYLDEIELEDAIRARPLVRAG